MQNLNQEDAFGSDLAHVFVELKLILSINNEWKCGVKYYILYNLKSNVFYTNFIKHNFYSFFLKLESKKNHFVQFGSNALLNIQ